MRKDYFLRGTLNGVGMAHQTFELLDVREQLFDARGSHARYLICGDARPARAERLLRSRRQFERSDLDACAGLGDDAPGAEG